MDSKCSMLVLSCDKNVGVLKIFFDFLRKNWPDCPYNVYLGMETWGGGKRI